MRKMKVIHWLLVSFLASSPLASRELNPKKYPEFAGIPWNYTKPLVKKLLLKKGYKFSEGGFNPEVRESVAEEDLIRSFGVETFPGAPVEF
jgi:hypothetical protein